MSARGDGRDEFYRFAIVLENICEGLWFEGNRASHKLRNIVTFQELAMVVGISTRQFERFCSLSVFVNMGKKRTGIVTIIPATAEYHPFAVR